MLEQVQQRLSGLYQADPGHDIRDFLITDRALAVALGGEALVAGSEETVLVAEDGDDVRLSVYLEAELLARLNSADPLNDLKPDQLADLCQVVEGVSHFNYLAWCAARDRPVTLFELELQAEVDKYLSTLILSLEQGDAFGARLHGWLFDDPAYRDELDAGQRERYEAASNYAGRFCLRLRERLKSGDRAALPELRQFYRCSQQGKISHIHARAFGRG